MSRASARALVSGSSLVRIFSSPAVTKVSVWSTQMTPAGYGGDSEFDSLKRPSFSTSDLATEAIPFSEREWVDTVPGETSAALPSSGRILSRYRDPSTPSPSMYRQYNEPKTWLPEVMTVGNQFRNRECHQTARSRPATCSTNSSQGTARGNMTGHFLSIGLMHGPSHDANSGSRLVR